MCYYFSIYSQKKRKKMKKYLFTLIIIGFTFNGYSQLWIENVSCSKKASEIVNQAITHLSNLEHLMAVGMADAALVVDKDCDCAKLVSAAAASNNNNWGSRASKLQDINTNNLNDIEKAWFMLLSTPNNKFNEASQKALKIHPESALINWLATRYDNFEGMKKFSEKFPDVSASAYNAMAYEYARNGDYDSAYDAIFKSLSLHDGSNAKDSRAEIAAMEGDYAKAVNSQLQAYAVAPFASPYYENLVIYSRNRNKEGLINGLKEAQIAVQDAVENQDLEEWKKYISDDMVVTAGDSNLSEFYDQTEEKFLEETNFTWNEFELKDIDVRLTPDMSTAILTFYAKGSFTMNESKEEVDYSTRASAVWIATSTGWKMVHTNYAPYGGAGIPN